MVQIDREREQLERERAEVQTRREAALGALELAREASRLNEDRTDARTVAGAVAAERVAVGEIQLQAADAVSRVLRLMLEGPTWSRRCGNIG